MYNMKIKEINNEINKELEFIWEISYILISKPAAPLLKSMRNSAGLSFLGGFSNEI